MTREGWKYVALPGEPWMLFNLKDDPYEQMNMAQITNYREILADLNERLQAWIDKTGDDFTLPKIEVPHIRKSRGNGVYYAPDKNWSINEAIIAIFNNTAQYFSF